MSGSRSAYRASLACYDYAAGNVVWLFEQTKSYPFRAVAHVGGAAAALRPLEVPVILWNLFRSRWIPPMSSPVGGRFVRPAALAGLCVAILDLGCATCTPAGEATTPVKVGADDSAGCRPNPQRVKRLIITEPGVYENYLVDGEWGSSTLVKINADNVVLRHCEIRHGTHNAVTVYASNVVIDSCRIHHVLAGSFDEQHDAHGITGRPTGLVVRNCDIGLVSGDCIQFDPGRGAWDDVVVENCTLWTGPLPADAGNFRRGQRPGENAVDTKQQTAHPRSRLTVRNCLLSGWKQPGQIGNMAALNLKDHVRVLVENCVLRDNEICFRVRGGTGERGGAQVTIDNCAVYDSQVAVRAENRIENLRLRRLGIGSGIQRKLQSAGGGTGPGYEYIAEYTPPPYESIIEQGLPR